MILPAWFDHLEDGFSYKKVQFKKFCAPVKTSCPPAENVNETPVGLFTLVRALINQLGGSLSFPIYATCPVK